MSKGPWKRKKLEASPVINGATALEKPKLGALNPLQAAQEAARNAQEGSLKLSKAVEVLRSGLEIISAAEMDRTTGMQVNPYELRKLAIDALDAYSAITGQSWRRHKLTGASRAGDKSVATLEA